MFALKQALNKHLPMLASIVAQRSSEAVGDPSVSA